MHHTKKLLLWLLCVLLTVLTLFGCSGQAGAEDDIPDAPLPMTDEARALLAPYMLVRPDLTEQAVIDAAVELRNECNLTITTDFVRRGDPVPEDNVEILVGETNRAASREALGVLTEYRKNNIADYIIRISDDKIVIVGVGADATAAAVAHFISYIAPRLTEKTLTEGFEEIYRRDYTLETIAGRSAGDYTILVPNTEEGHALASELQARVTDLTGFVLPISDGKVETPAVMSVGAVGTDAHEAAVRELTDFRKNCYSDWLVRADTDGIVCAGVTEEGCAAAVDYFMNTVWPALEKGEASAEFISRKEYDTMTLNQKSIGDYRIVIPENASVDIVNAANAIHTLALTKAGFDLAIVREGASAESTAPCIRFVVGEGELSAAQIAFAGDDLVISGGHYYPVAKAAEELCTALAGGEVAGDYTLQIVSDTVPLTSERYPEMTLVWNDEFDDDTDQYDRMKWLQRAQMAASDMYNSTTERNVKTEDGNLVLRSWKEDEEEIGKPYSTNMSMTTRDSCNYCYGYLEMRAKVPFAKGAWPSFWMVQREDMRAEGQDWNAEIDIFEVFGSKDRLVPNIHKWYDTDGYHVQLDGNRKTYYVFRDIENLSDEYHTYGFYWDETKMIFSVDGEDYCEFDITEASGDFGQYPGMSGFHTPNYIILNNFLFTPEADWIPDGSVVDDNVRYPVTYTIDYMRLWQGENGIFRAPNLETPAEEAPAE